MTAPAHREARPQPTDSVGVAPTLGLNPTVALAPAFQQITAALQDMALSQSAVDRIGTDLAAGLGVLDTARGQAQLSADVFNQLGTTMAAALRGSVNHGQTPPDTWMSQFGRDVATRLSSLHEAQTAPTRRPHTRVRRFAAAASVMAEQARTIAEFGDALRALRNEANWSQNQLAEHFKDESTRDKDIVGLSKTRLSNACNGHQLFQTERQVRYFVIACDAEPDLDVWTAAYHRVKKNGGRRERGPATPARNEPAATPASATAPKASASPRSLLSGPDDEVVHVLQIPITRGQVRTALAIIATLGVIATRSSTPTIRTAGLTALGFAAATAAADRAMATRHLPPAST